MNMDNMREYLNKIISLEQEQPVEESDIDQIAEVGKVYPKIAKLKMKLIDDGMEPEDAHDEACEKYDVDPAMCEKYIQMQMRKRRMDRQKTESKELDESALKDMMQDVEEGMDKAEFEKKYPGQNYDEIKKDIEDRMNEETVEEGAMKELLHDLAGKRDLEDFVNDASDYGMTDEEATEFWKSVNEDVNEDDAMVSVPVQELADILQLAGYENYADKIEEYANEPEEEYSDTEDQLIGLSGGLNRPKKQYPASAPGDNPMDQEPREIEESVEDKLYKSYKDFLEAEEIKSND